MKGKIIVDFEQDEENKCSWKIQQKGKDNLDNENLIFLFEHIISELMADEK